MTTRRARRPHTVHVELVCLAYDTDDAVVEAARACRLVNEGNGLPQDGVMRLAGPVGGGDPTHVYGPGD